MRIGPFDAKKTFQLIILTVRAVIKIKRLKYTPEPLSLETARYDPYRIKTLRKVRNNQQQKETQITNILTQSYDSSNRLLMDVLFAYTIIGLKEVKFKIEPRCLKTGLKLNLEQLTNNRLK